MFANALRTTVARSAARQTIGMRYASTVAAKPQGNVLMRFIKGMPVEVYPLVFVVTAACSFSVVIGAKHLSEDALRFTPSSNTYVDRRGIAASPAYAQSS